MCVLRREDSLSRPRHHDCPGLFRVVLFVHHVDVRIPPLACVSSRRAAGGRSSVSGRPMSADARVPGSPRGRRRGRSWSRSASRSPSPRGGRADDGDVRDRAYRSRSRSRDVVRDDDRRGRGPPGVRRGGDESQVAARARRIETHPEPLSYGGDPNASHSGFGLGYRREDDGALRATSRGSKNASGFGSREEHDFPRETKRPPDKERKGNGKQTRRTGGDYNPLRREVGETRATSPAGRTNKTSFESPTNGNTASYEYLVASGSLGWRASGGALPRRAERIEGVGDETLASLAASLRDARDASRARREAEELFYQKTRDGSDGSNGFEALESRRAFSTRRVGAATRKARGGRFAEGNDERREGDGGAAATSLFVRDGGETTKNGDSFPVRELKNRGVADRARLDDCARAEADFASSADGVRFALAKKAETYKSLLLRKTFGARDGYGVDFDAKSAADAASFRDAEAPPFAEVPPPPPGGPRVDDAALVAKKRQRLIALKNRGRERTTTAADGADA